MNAHESSLNLVYDLDSMMLPEISNADRKFGSFRADVSEDCERMAALHRALHSESFLNESPQSSDLIPGKDGKTPAEVAGIELQLQGNKWEALMKKAGKIWLLCRSCQVDSC